MYKLLRLTLASAAATLVMQSTAAANPDGSFSGPGILTNYQTPDKPVKEKNMITLEFSSSSPDTTFQVNDDPFPSDGSAFAEGRYVFVKYQTGASVLSGRLLIKGKPGAETGLSGTLFSTFNGYTGFYEYKVNLKKQ